MDGKPVEDTWRAHQVPITDFASKPGHLKILEDWMKSYKPEELFDAKGKLHSGTRRARAQGHPPDGRQSRMRTAGCC